MVTLQECKYSVIKAFESPDRGVHIYVKSKNDSMQKHASFIIAPKLYWISKFWKQAWIAISFLMIFFGFVYKLSIGDFIGMSVVTGFMFAVSTGIFCSILEDNLKTVEYSGHHTRYPAKNFQNAWQQALDYEEKWVKRINADNEYDEFVRGLADETSKRIT